MRLVRVLRHGTIRLKKQEMVEQECVRMPKSIQPADVLLRLASASCWRQRRQVREKGAPWLVCRAET